MKKTFTLILAIATSIACLAQKEDLKLKLEEGKTYKQTTNSKANINQDINGQKMDMTMTVKGTMSYLVKKVNENDYDMEVKYENLSMSMEMPQGSMEFSSEKNDENDPFSLILGQMKNQPFEVKMTKSGKILEVKNINLIWESAFKKFPQMPEAQVAQIKSQLEKAYGEEAFKGSIEMVTAIFPDKPVAKQDTWIIKTKLQSGMSADVTTTFKFTEKNKDYTLIVGDSKIETTDKDTYFELNGMSVKYDLSGTMTLQIKIDNTTGWIIEAKTNQDIKGSTFIKESAQIPNGMKIPMIMKNEMIITNN